MDVLKGFLIGALVGALLYFVADRIFRPSAPPEHVTREIILHDTTRVRTPVYLPIISRPAGLLLVPVAGDTIRRNDTLFVQVEREQREYSDTTFRAWVSGYEPRLDSIEVYNRTIVREVVRDSSPWSLGVTAGVGAGRDGLTPFVGVGVSYNFLHLLQKRK